VVRNDWSRLSPPDLAGWQPTRTVSVIIPAYNCQANLELTLASLRQQTYPADLLEVVVVDDGSQQPLVLPELRPANTRLVRVPELNRGWGRANALHTGAEQATGEILHWLDSDMVVFPEHVAAQARWHHVAYDVVTLGYKRIVTEPGDTLTPTEVIRRAQDGTLGEAFPPGSHGPHDYVEAIIDKTDQLRGGDHLNFRAHVGATAALRRDFYFETGGLARDLHLGEDTEFGFRLTQAGAVFVPEPAARSWHLGPTSMMGGGEALRRFNHPFLADAMPQPRWLRVGAHRVRAIPLVTAVVPVEGSFELVRACVDRLLASDEHDLRVVLVGPFDALTDGRRSILGDPSLDLRLIEATYRSDARVEFATQAPETVYPSPYRLDVPARVGVGLTTVRRLVAEADARKAGLVTVTLRSSSSSNSPVANPSVANPSVANPSVGGLTVALWRTAAVSRAMRVAQAGESLADTVTQVYGTRTVSPADVDLTELFDVPGPGLASPAPRLADGVTATFSSGPLSDSDNLVVVGGVRSLMRAARMVARHSLRRLRKH
jgi:glycosyltransferase involved in cell wall biosynthesis